MKKGLFRWDQGVVFVEPQQLARLTPFLCPRRPIFRLIPAGPNRSRAGRRPPSTASTEGTASRRSPKSSPRPAKADTLCWPTRTRDEAGCRPNSWSGFWLRVVRRRGLQGSSVTSTTSTQLDTPSLSWISAPTPKVQMQTRFCFRPVQTGQLPKRLLAPVTVKILLAVHFSQTGSSPLTVSSSSFPDQITSFRTW